MNCHEREVRTVLMGPGEDVARQKNAFTRLFEEGCGILKPSTIRISFKLLNCLWEARASCTAVVDIGFFMRSKIYPLFVM